MASSTLNSDGSEINSPPTSKLLVLSLAFTERFQLLDVISNHCGAAADTFPLFINARDFFSCRIKERKKLRSCTRMQPRPRTYCKSATLRHSTTVSHGQRLPQRPEPDPDIESETQGHLLIPLSGLQAIERKRFRLQHCFYSCVFSTKYRTKNHRIRQPARTIRYAPRMTYAATERQRSTIFVTFSRN